jgi:carbamoylphosphate synthase small subunit
VYPWDTPASDILAAKPDGVVLSNGPGDPKDCAPALPHIRTLTESGVPLFAICLGHQLVALATGADTYKLKFGHRGCNHPVRELAPDGSRSLLRTTVCGDATASIPDRVVTHVNLNDGQSKSGVSGPPGVYRTISPEGVRTP